MVDNGARTPGSSSSASGGGVFTIPTNIPPPPQYCTGPCGDLSPTQHALQHSLSSDSTIQHYQSQGPTVEERPHHQQQSSQHHFISHLDHHQLSSHPQRVAASFPQHPSSSSPRSTPPLSSTLPHTVGASQSTALPSQLSVAVMSSPKTIGIITPSSGLDPKHYKTLQQYQHQHHHYSPTSQHTQIAPVSQQSFHSKPMTTSEIVHQKSQQQSQHRGFPGTIQPSAIHYIEPQPGITIGYSTLPRTGGQASVVLTNEGAPSSKIGAYLDVSTTSVNKAGLNTNTQRVNWTHSQMSLHNVGSQNEEGEESAV